MRNQLPEKELDALWEFYKSAYDTYQFEVVKCGKLYNRYKNDFLKSHTYTNRVDTAGKNEHIKNLGIMCELLNDRQDLVEKYFIRPKFEFNDQTAMQHELDTTAVVFSYNDLPYQKDVFVSERNFQCYFTSLQLNLLTQSVNELHLFSSNVTNEEMRQLFSGKLCCPLKSTNNRIVAFFFDALCSQNLICKQWQEVIDRNNLILSSADGRPLNCTKISSALNMAKQDNRSIYVMIKKSVQHIATS